jgi:protein gp37
MSDLFHDDIPESYILAVFQVMARTPHHTYLVLTKRPERMCRILNSWQAAGLTLREGCGAILPNVWLGISAGTQKHLLDFAPWLLETPAAIRFLSLEPMLGPIVLSEIVARDGDGPGRNSLYWIGSDAEISWVIVGGESGPGARPFDIQWARSVVQQCKAAGVSCFVKQVGTNSNLVDWTERKQISRKGGDTSEWPEDLRVREFPK